MRAGVFLCECGGNISSVVNLEPLAEHARSLDGVVEVNVNQFMCCLLYTSPSPRDS